MRPFAENFPFFCIFLALGAGIVSAVLPGGRAARRLTLTVCAADFLLSAGVLSYTYGGQISFVYTMGRFQAPYGNAIQGGPWQALLAMTFSSVMGLSLLGGSRDLFRDVRPDRQPLYFTMVDLTLASLLVLTYTADVFTGYVFIEISTLAACALVMAKDTGTNLVAALRYLFMSLLGSSLFLLGLTLLNSITGYLLMEPLAPAVERLWAADAYHMPLRAAMALIVVGLGVKSAMYPFHLWLPDAHGGATTASSAILSGLVLKGYIALEILLLVRVFSLELVRQLGVADVLLVLGLLGMVMGSVSAMREHHIKRMLAFSSVAQIGYVFMGLGLGTEAGLLASCFHVLVHACCKPLLFCCAGRLSTVSAHHHSLRSLRGSAYRDVTAGVGFTVGALSMIGIPLFGGFVSKLYFASASLYTGRMALVLAGIALSTVLNSLYYVPAVLSIWGVAPEELKEEVRRDTRPEDGAFDRCFTLAAVVLMVFLVALGTLYGPITDVLRVGLALLK
ncbi:complex I subunit 5 family protein [Dysosmobacter sp.]|uniref:complex I subunit 5 family protein n=1 Tax=Dysosmobacter sp. TaxID=2591382 RepID=UPI002A8CC476|nr:proton-conducting transporter membrane subunit [Dysosmobacter sp.]MDY3282159.1 proton-conducting transporter membrane subunit [Dysosmobacter sp.]